MAPINPSLRLVFSAGAGNWTLFSGGAALQAAVAAAAAAAPAAASRRADLLPAPSVCCWLRRGAAARSAAGALLEGFAYRYVRVVARANLPDDIAPDRRQISSAAARDKVRASRAPHEQEEWPLGPANNRRPAVAASKRPNRYHFSFFLGNSKGRKKVHSCQQVAARRPHILHNCCVCQFASRRPSNWLIFRREFAADCLPAPPHLEEQVNELKWRAAKLVVVSLAPSRVEAFRERGREPLIRLGAQLGYCLVQVQLLLVCKYEVCVPNKTGRQREREIWILSRAQIF